MAQAARRKQAMSAGREAILQSISKARAAARPVPDYALPPWTADPVSQFIAKAQASVARVHEIAAPADAPAAIWAIIAAQRLIPRLHIPASSPLRALPWHAAPGLLLSAAAPSGEDSAIAAPDYAIAETGTVVFFSGPDSPSSWHFRPGREFMLLPRARILPRLEDILAPFSAGRPLPATLNLVTGPSRTADIEQTIELGAHGPREIHILITG
jgi:L-lactate dehydrogenase complex protein LldG